MKSWQNKDWCIPANENAVFVCAMENVLDVYKRSYDETHSLVCMDESSKQHIKKTHQLIPAKPGTVENYDTEYDRNGLSNMFMVRTVRGKTACGGNESKDSASNSQPG